MQRGYHFNVEREPIFKLISDCFTETIAEEIISFDPFLKDVVFICDVPDVTSSEFLLQFSTLHEAPAKVALRYSGVLGDIGGQGDVRMITFVHCSNEIHEILRISVSRAMYEIKDDNLLMTYPDRDVMDNVVIQGEDLSCITESGTNFRYR